jgi:phosphopantothenoylcysteine decarboxylase/phosphopantothenate--cysteine ligase
MTFQAVSGREVRSDLWDPEAEKAMSHIELARWADFVMIAPATADFIARLATGQADDLLTTLCLATSAPIALAPAMNRLMWANAATQANVATLKSRGVHVWGPGEGDQACGRLGPAHARRQRAHQGNREYHCPPGPRRKRVLLTPGARGT